LAVDLLLLVEVVADGGDALSGPEGGGVAQRLGGEGGLGGLAAAAALAAAHASDAAGTAAAPLVLGIVLGPVAAACGPGEAGGGAQDHRQPGEGVGAGRSRRPAR